MPMIRVEMQEGRSLEQKRALVKALTEATVATLGRVPDAVSVVIYDVPKTHWARAGVLWSDKPAT